MHEFTKNCKYFPKGLGDGNGKIVLDQIKQMFHKEEREEMKDKMLTFLIGSYLKSKLTTPNKVSFLSGKPNMATYLLKILFNNANKREYMKTRDAIREYLESNNTDYNFEISQDAITYLIDLSEDKKSKVEELINGNELVQMREVTEIGEEEKKLLLRRAQRSYR